MSMGKVSHVVYSHLQLALFEYVDGMNGSEAFGNRKTNFHQTNISTGSCRGYQHFSI